MHAWRAVAYRTAMPYLRSVAHGCQYGTARESVVFHAVLPVLYFVLQCEILWLSTAWPYGTMEGRGQYCTEYGTRRGVSKVRSAAQWLVRRGLVYGEVNNVRGSDPLYDRVYFGTSIDLDCCSTLCCCSGPLWSGCGPGRSPRWSGLRQE